MTRLGWIFALTALLAVGCGDGMDTDGGTDDGGEVDPDGGDLRDAGPGSGSCSDGIRNQDESDVDCGGVCGATCRPGDMCGDGDDCTTSECSGGVCVQAASCTDGAMNGMETDVDCGGPLCNACADGQMCGEGADCTSMVCTGGTCAAPACGDGVVNIVIEECDGDGMGAGGETATCDADCTTVACGDGTINMTAGETCEEGGVETATCDADCTAPMCGDGVANAAAGETCDGDGMGTGGETATCDADCSAASCGDGVVNATAGETCDDSGESVTCDSDCTAAMCGDGVLNASAGEQCDDGNTMDGDRCSSMCVAPPDLTITGLQRFNTDTGALDGVVAPAWDATRSALVVGNFNLPAGATLFAFGSNPLIVEAATDITIAGTINAAGEDGGSSAGAGGCNDVGGIGGRGGPGGFNGGDGGDGVIGGGTPGPTDTLNGAPGMGPGGGGAGLSDSAGGAGAGHLEVGADGQGGTGGAGGAIYSGLTPLRGGSGGGGGSGDDDGAPGLNAGDDGGGAGGGGGGAVRLDALNLVTVTGTIDVGGGDGGAGCPNTAGSGGGGSGGTVVVFSGGADPVLTGRVNLAGGTGDLSGANGGNGAVGELYLDGTCTDGRVNQDEVDVDCGGAICGGCADGLRCEVDSDCVSMACSEFNTCILATCADGMMNAGETDVDCGGPSCFPCLAGQMCAAATDCASGGCTAGACDADGHTVLIGHDYFLTNGDMDLLLGNSVLLTPETGTIEVLVYTQFADVPQEVTNTENAITGVLAPFRTANFTRFSDFGMLGATLTPDTDVILIPEQENAADAAVMNSVGALWRPDLEAFLDRGGVIILCSWSQGNGWRIYDAAGLMTITGRTSIIGATVNVVDPTSPIATAVAATYTARSGSAFFQGVVGGRTVVERNPGEPVVQHRVRGLP